MPVDRRHRPRRPAAGAGRGGGVLRRQRGAHQRRPPLARAPAPGCTRGSHATGSCSPSTDDGVGGADRRRPRLGPRRPGPPPGGARRELRVHSPPGGPTEVRMACPVLSPRLRIVLAEDAALLREGLVAILERAGHEVAAAVGDADALLAYVDRAARPTWWSPTSGCRPTHTDEGLRAAAAIRAAHPDIAIMVLSAYVADAYVAELLDRRARRRDRLPAQGPGRPRPRVPRQPRPGGRRRDRRRPGGGATAAAAASDRRTAGGADRARARRPRPDGRGPHQRLDRRGARGQRGRGAQARRQHLREARLDPASDRRVSAVLAYLRG